MTGKIFGLNGTMLNSSQEYKEQLVNELIRLTSVASVPVISRTVTTPPTSGLTPDSYYIVPTGATGAWAGKTNQIAFPLIGVNGQPNGDWGFWLPFTGVKVSLISGSDLFFNGTNWQTVTGAGDMLVAEYGGSATGIVAKADEIAGNPSNDTFYGKESGNKGFFGFFSKVLSTPLTALSTTTGGAITATDTLLISLGKIQNQINSINPSGDVLTTVLTGLSTTTGGAITATDNVLQGFGKLQKQFNDLNITGVTDGDKGDITVSNSGTTWTIDNQSVTYSKLQQTNTGNIALGKPTNGSGTITEIPIGVGANNLIQLDSTAKLPAVDGSQLTNLPVLSATQIRDSLATLTGNDRLDASTIKNLPTGGGSGGLNIVSPTANDFPVVANDLVVANNFSVALPSTPQENTLIYFLVLENPCLVFGTETYLNSQVNVASFKINPQGFIIPLLFKNSRWNIFSSYVSDIVSSTNLINLSNYQSPGDTNGIIYYLGTTAINSQTFVNPVPSQVVATSSGVHDPGPTFGLQEVTDRNLNTGWHASSATPPPSQIFQLDFQDRKVDLTRIVIRPWARTDGLPVVSPTIVEASNDGSNWTAIHSFTGGAFAGQDLISPELQASGTPSRYIRFRRTSGDSSTWWQQVLGEIELYGFLYQVINLVSNLPPITTSLQFGSAIATDSWVRSSFTTGSNPFILTSVTLQFRQNTADANLFVRIYEDNAGLLGNLITGFINPSSISTTVPHGASTVFTLTTPQTLAVNTSYWLVVGIDAPVGTGGEYSWRGTNSFDQTGEPGWSIGNSSLFSGNQGGTWNVSTIANAFQFSINGQSYSL